MNSRNPFFLFIAVFILLTGCASAFSGGSGTSADPWQISTIEELQSINDSSDYFDDSFILINDIDASGTISWNSGSGFYPIGSSTQYFTGSFDGDGYTISDLYINRPAMARVGLFGWTQSAQISNLGLIDIDITGLGSVGGLDAWAVSTTISNCYVTGSVQASSTNVGGFAGRTATNCVISDCWADVYTYGTGDTGGFIGTVYSSTTLTNCYSVGLVDYTSTSVGGFVGKDYTSTSTANNCYWDTSTSGKSSSALGTGKTTVEMGEVSTFTGWDFSNIWIMSEPYPVFRRDIENVYVRVTILDESNESLKLIPETLSIYTENSSYSGSYNITSKITTFTVSPLISEYVLSGSSDNYYPRSQIIVWEEVYNDVNLYLISENETVIYDRFSITDNTINDYDNGDYIIRLDKPLDSGTQTIFSSYFDFNGVSACYLVATDQYILYVITPDQTISYGWLTPDSDGEIDIVIGEYDLVNIEEWLTYDYTDSNNTITFDYQSTEDIYEASFIIKKDGEEVYSSSMNTDSGYFAYNNFSSNGTYFIDINVETVTGDTFTYQRYEEIGDNNKHALFPESYSLLLKSIITVFIIVVGILAASSYRADIAALWTGSIYDLGVYQEWIYGTYTTAIIISIVCLAAMVKFNRIQNRGI